MNSLLSNNRAVSEVIGAILLFALVISALALVQATAVPTWNQQEEFEHSDRIVSELSQFSDDLERSATTGAGTTRSLDLGVEYQSRPFLFNPSSPAGNLQLVDGPAMVLGNVAADGETGDYWTGESREFPTAAIHYEPAYNEYRNAPTTVIESGTMYNRYGSVNVVLADGQVIEDRQITLRTMDGRMDYSTTGVQPVTVVPLSAPAQNIPVHAATPGPDSDWEPVTLTIPSGLSLAEWEARYADQFYDPTEPASGNVLDISAAGEGAVLIELRPVDDDGRPIVYSLSLAHLGIETGYDRQVSGAHYLTTEGPVTLTARPTEARDLTVQVRDRFNNPVTDERVSFSTRQGSLTARDGRFGAHVDVWTDRNGEATVAHQRVSVGTTTIEASIGDGTADRERVAFSFVSSDPDDRAPGEGTINQPSPLRLHDAFAESECKPNQDTGCTVHLEFSNLGSSSIDVEMGRFAFFGAAGPGVDSAQLPHTLEFPVNGTLLEIRDEYVNLAPTLIAPGADWDLDVLFRDGLGDRYEVETSEFFVISLIADGDEFTYFVNPIGS